MPLENRKTVNLEWYMTICLPEVFEEIIKNDQQRRIILHHDNTSCHTSAETIRFSEGQKIELTSHPPYGPDLAPNDFYLFPSVNYVINVFQAAKRPSMRVLEIPQSEWKKCYKN
ncbi:Mariner Mos1 transposase [Eumeta japonica]|uniref:Mariner Mos1 transposase n=1 Tax=Eumeta variegata TaxID=151549 RepID=A0A4C2A701_EUMVA|nr:Mariner Mos1 transposase [Eumeta japonica]